MEDSLASANATLPTNATALSPSNVKTALAALGVVTLILCSTVGNLLVIAFYSCNKKLRRVGNLFILSLAIADFLVAAFTEPMALSELLHDEWIFSNGFCRVYLAVDWLCTDASLFSILLISFDRYLAILHPFKYRTVMTTRRAIILISGAWLLAFLMYGPAIYAWPLPDDYDPSTCLPPFKSNWKFTLAMGVIEFAIPLAGLVFFNASIYYQVVARKHSPIRESINMREIDPHLSIKTSALVRSAIHDADNADESSSSGNDKEAANEPSMASQEERRDERRLTSSPSGGTEADAETDTGGPKPKENRANRPSKKLRFSFGKMRRSTSGGTESSFVRRQQVQRNAHVLALLQRQHRKAARALALLVGIFTLCWAPYMVISISNAACDCVPSLLSDLSVWLLWLNSFVNPFLYAAGNKTFLTLAKNALFCRHLQARDGVRRAC